MTFITLLQSGSIIDLDSVSFVTRIQSKTAGRGQNYNHCGLDRDIQRANRRRNDVARPSAPDTYPIFHLARITVREHIAFAQSAARSSPALSFVAVSQD